MPSPESPAKRTVTSRSERTGLRAGAEGGLSAGRESGGSISVPGWGAGRRVGAATRAAGWSLRAGVRARVRGDSAARPEVPGNSDADPGRIHGTAYSSVGLQPN